MSNFSDQDVGRKSTLTGLVVNDGRLSYAASRVTNKAIKKALYNLSSPNEQRVDGKNFVASENLNSERKSGPEASQPQLKRPDGSSGSESADETESQKQNTSGVDPGFVRSIPGENIGENASPGETLQQNREVGGSESGTPAAWTTVGNEIDTNTNGTNDQERAQIIPALPVDREGANTLTLLAVDTRMSTDLGEPSSTHVLVPVNTLPEESEIKLEDRSAFVEKHAIPIESTQRGGKEIHRNPADSHMQIVRVKEAVGEALPMPASSIVLPNEINMIPPGGGETSAGKQEDENSSGQRDDTGQQNIPNQNATARGVDEFQSMIDEMAAAVAAEALAIPSMAFFQELTIKISAVAASAKVTAFSFMSNSGPGGSGAGTQCDSEGRQRSLPPEVKDYIIRTLSEIMAQLNSVKAQLRERETRPGGNQ